MALGPIAPKTQGPPNARRRAHLFRGDIQIHIDGMAQSRSGIGVTGDDLKGILAWRDSSG
jgi:hypothetical protein